MAVHLFGIVCEHSVDVGGDPVSIF